MNYGDDNKGSCDYLHAVEQLAPAVFVSLVVHLRHHQLGNQNQRRFADDDEAIAAIAQFPAQGIDGIQGTKEFRDQKLILRILLVVQNCPGRNVIDVICIRFRNWRHKETARRGGSRFVSIETHILFP